MSTGAIRDSKSCNNSSVSERRERYIPALSLRWLTPIYDPVVALTTREGTFKRRLVQEMNLAMGDRVLDVGCGTGTLALFLKRAQPGIVLVGVDGDDDVLKRAAVKASGAGLEVEFTRGLAGGLPFADSTFDKAASTLVFHHLLPAVKNAAFRDILRILRPAGTLFLADFSGVPTIVAKSLLLPFRVFDGLENTADNFYGRLPGLMSAAGFARVQERARYITPVGPVSILSGEKP